MTRPGAATCSCSVPAAGVDVLVLRPLMGAAGTKPRAAGAAAAARNRRRKRVTARFISVSGL